MILYDSREPDVIKTLVRVAAPASEERALPAGDFWLTPSDSDSPLVIIERKTAADLLASIKDGRFREQRQRMLDSGARVVYILEGQIADDRLVQGALENLAVRHGCGLVPTLNPEATVRTVVSMHAKLAAPPQAGGHAMCRSKAAQIETEKNALGPLACLLLTVRGVSPAVASAICKVYHTPLALIEDKGQKIDNTTFGKTSRRVGKVLATRIRHAFCI